MFMGSSFDALLSQIALDEQWLTSEQLEKIFALQKKKQKEGKAIPLLVLLQKLGYLDLSRMEVMYQKNILWIECRSCLKHHNHFDYRTLSKSTCPECQGVLRLQATKNLPSPSQPAKTSESTSDLQADFEISVDEGSSFLHQQRFPEKKGNASPQPSPPPLAPEKESKKSAVTTRQKKRADAPTPSPTLSQAVTQSSSKAPSQAPSQAVTQSSSKAPSQAPSQAVTQSSSKAPSQAPSKTEALKSLEGLEGKTLAGYRILQKIGQGGMGVVYGAEHLGLKKKVALKILFPHLVTPQSVQRFYQEAQVVARLEHPNIIKVQDIGESEGFFYLAMQYLEGHTLEKEIREYGTIVWPRAVYVMYHVAQGLARAHDLGIVHRDVKPENILISRQNEICITDFGLVRDLVQNLDISYDGQVIGTPYFMSPEQCDGRSLDTRSDIYSLGISFYYALTGTKPFKAASLSQLLIKHLQETAPSPRKIVGDLPVEIENILATMMAKKPEDRYPKMQDILNALAPFLPKDPSIPSCVTLIQKLPPSLSIPSLSSFHPDLLKQASQAYQRKDYQKVFSLLKTLPTQHEIPLDTYQYRGDAAFQLQHFKEALADYTYLLQHRKEEGILYFQRGQARSALKDFQGAIHDYTQALSYDPENKLKYYQHRSSAKTQAGDLQGASLDALLSKLNTSSPSSEKEKKPDSSLKPLLFNKFFILFLLFLLIAYFLYSLLFKNFF
jgi:serine/threonine protein kinase